MSFIQGHQLLALEQGGDPYYFVTDDLSSVRVIVGSGSVVDESVTDEFGRPRPTDLSPILGPGPGPVKMRGPGP